MARTMSLVGRAEEVMVEVKSQEPEIVRHDTWELGALRANFAAWARLAALVAEHGSEEDREVHFAAVRNAKELVKRNEREDQRNRDLIAVVSGEVVMGVSEPDGVA